MRILMKGILCFVSIAITLLFAIDAKADVRLSVTPITWNIIGLDSNSPASGPNRFPVGARICNTGETNAGNVTASFIWDDDKGVFVGDVNADLYINLRAGSLSSISIGALAAGSCSDAYFEVEVTKVAAAFNKTRRYHITATDSGSGATGSSPRPRELYVEHLISQNRNSVTKVELNGTAIPAGGTMDLVVGHTYNITLYAKTATQGYEQLEAFINFPNTIFQILSVNTTYSANTSPYVSNPNDKLYADACRWQNDPDNPNYLSCISSGKSGGTVVTMYTVRIVSGAGTSQTLDSLIYDFSGSSFHYNADYGVGARIANIFGPASIALSKSFNPKAIAPGATSTMTFKIKNPTGETITGVNFTDVLQSGLAVDSTPNLSYIGCGPSPSPSSVSGGTTSLLFSNITLSPNSVCTISLTVTAPAGTYPNTTSTLKINGTTDTGNTASDALTVSTAPACIPNQPIAQWTFPPGFYVSSPAPSTGSGTASPGAGVNAASFALGTNSWGSNGGIAIGTPVNPAHNDYFQFAINTTDYSSVNLTFDARRGNSANSPVGVAVYYGSAAGNPETGTSLYANPNVLTTTFTNIGGTLTFTPTSATTYVRIYFFNSQSTNPGADAMIDNVTFTGCAIPAPAPTISKSFTPDPIVMGASSTLTFVINNTQPGSRDLSGIAFTDLLPAGLEIDNPNGLSGSCGGGTITAVAGTQTISLSGASLAAGTSCNFSVSVKGVEAGEYENTTSFLSTTQTGTTSSYATDTLTVIAPPELEKSFAPASILVGETSTLTFTISNSNQTTELTDIGFTDTLPAGLTVATSGPTTTCGGSLTTTAPKVITFSGGSLAANASCIFDVTVTGVTVGSKTNTTSTITSSEGGEGAAATATLIVSDPQPLLGLNKQISTDGTNWFKFVGVVLPGDLYYRFTISNDGETALNGVSVTDPDVTLCSLPTSLAIGESASCVVGPLPVTSVPTPNPFINTATAESASTSPVTSSARYGTKSLSITKSADKSGFSSVGELLTYSYLVTNDGGYPLLGPVTIADDKSADETCPDVSTVGDFDGYLDPGESITCSATYKVTAGDMLAGFVTNAAYATAEDVTSNTDTETVNSPGADLAITKTDNPDPVIAGQNLTYTITVNNAGPSDASNVVVIDTLPAGVTFISTTGCAGDPNGVPNCNLGTITSGGNKQYTATVTVNAGTTGTVTNNVSVTASTADPNSANNSASATTTVNASADLSITKSDNPDPITAGQTITYTLQVTNNGPSTANSLTVTDTLPVEVTYVSATGTGWNCSHAAGVVTCTRASLTVGAAPDITITVTAPSQGGSITNNTTVNAATPDPNNTNNSASATTTVNEPSLFDPPSGFKTFNSAGYPELVWRMVWINSGNADAIAAVITDNIPANTRYVNGSLSCSPQGGSSTSQCYFDNVNNRIVWTGTIAADPGAQNETQARNEVVITFRTAMNTSVTRVENQGCAQIPGGQSRCTDDPSTSPSGDPTVWTKADAPVAVPTIGEWGFIILIALQGLAAIYYLRRQIRS